MKTSYGAGVPPHEVQQHMQSMVGKGRVGKGVELVEQLFFIELMQGEYFCF